LGASSHVSVVFRRTKEMPVIDDPPPLPRIKAARVLRRGAAHFHTDPVEPPNPFPGPILVRPVEEPLDRRTSELGRAPARRTGNGATTDGLEQREPFGNLVVTSWE
jgi:hypothetical protein